MALSWHPQIPILPLLSKTVTATNAVSKATVERTILEEIAEGNYVITDSKPIIIRALGAIPKPDSFEVHLIRDCSRPIGRGSH